MSSVRVGRVLLPCLLILLAEAIQGCSSGGDGDGPQGGATGSGGAGNALGGGGGSTGLIGTFQLLLNPKVVDTEPYTSIFGTVYGSPYPTDVIETSIASNTSCNVYRYSRQSCTSPTCTGSQACVSTNVCKDKPSLVSVGDVTLTGVGDSQLKLTAINNNYQYPLELPYPGFAEGSTVTLNAAGGALSPFTLSAKGVAPLATKEASYLIASGKDLSVEWTPGANTEAKISISLNISKHGGSAGYMRCETTDSGSFTIPANLLKALTDLGVAGYPELLLVRSTRTETSIAAGKVAFEIAAPAKPALNVEGYCSCFDSSECGSCSDSTKTVCDSVKKLCHAP